MKARAYLGRAVMTPAWRPAHARGGGAHGMRRKHADDINRMLLAFLFQARRSECGRSSSTCTEAAGCSAGDVTFAHASIYHAVTGAATDTASGAAAL